jgi:3-isopropylmalate/(R)-2-methylmalate dehydratase small subunit
MMPGFVRHTGKLAVYNADQVDTDRIIPARFLSRVSRLGYGELLFCDIRGADFPLDQVQAEGATILVAGTNFGCGSSREHAVWALQQAGFLAVIARVEPKSPGFSDIFRQNAANCGLLLVELKPEDHQVLVDAGQGAEAEVDLANQVVSCSGRTLMFEIAPALKDQILAGHDLVGTTLVYEEAIKGYEQARGPVVHEPAGRS